MTQAQHNAREAGYALTFSPTGPTLVPLREGRPMTPEEYGALSLEEKGKIAEDEKPVAEMVGQVGERLRGLEREVAAAVQQLDRQVVETIVSGPFDALDKEHAERRRGARVPQATPRVHAEERGLPARSSPRSRRPPRRPWPRRTPGGAPLDPFLAFRVNVLVDNGGRSEPPIIFEPNPTFTNLFGRIDRRAFMGTYLSDHTMLKPGAMHRANGGYLILAFNDLVTKPGAWDGLKRALRTREVRLEDPMEQYGLLTPQTLRPEPIPIDVKLVVTGDTLAYFMLSAYDEESWELFKVKADFDYQIERDPANALAYAAFVCTEAERSGLRHFDRTAVAAPHRIRRPSGGGPGEALGALRPPARHRRRGGLLGGARRRGARRAPRTSTARSTSGCTA